MWCLYVSCALLQGITCLFTYSILMNTQVCLEFLKLRRMQFCNFTAAVGVHILKAI